MILDAQSIAYLDVTAADALTQLDEELQASGQQLLVASDIGHVRDVLRRASEDPDFDRVLPNIPAAVAAVGGGAAQPATRS